MISRIGSLCARVFYYTCPDPFVIAILLTLLSAILALTIGESSPAKLLDAWRDGGDGIWKLLSFAMQMCLILVTGHALASTRAVRGLIHSLARRPQTAEQAVGLVGLAACVTGVINWGLGLIVGALIAREVGISMHRRSIRVHYPLLAAAGYVGLMIWHGGLSGSAPLNATSAREAAKVLPKDVLHLIGDGVPLSETTFSAMNLFITGGLIVLTPLMLMALMPKRPEEMKPIEEFESMRPLLNDTPLEVSTQPNAGSTIPDWLDRSPFVAWLLAIPLLLAVGRFIWVSGGGVATQSPSTIDVILGGLKGFGLNEINAGMLALGLILHGSPRAYMNAVEDGARGCAGIIIQFPLYAGIMAIMISSGLVRQMATMFGDTGSVTLVPVLSFFAACVINLFIPSGGGQWAVQGPVALLAGDQVGAPVGKMVMSVAYGDQLTNMLQPFWALPLLSITGVAARDIVGYTAVVMVLAGAWITLGLLLF